MTAARSKSTQRDRRAPPAATAPSAHHGAGLAPREIFFTRLRRAVAYALGLVATTLLIGMLGYRIFEDLSWLDAFHQSALLLSGMGPVVDVKSTAGKLFDSIYALFCGVVLLAATGLMFAPVLHRLLHRFHLEDASDR